MKKLILAMALGMLPLAALANFDCGTRVNNVLVYSDGSVNVFFAIRGDYTYICNLTTPRLGVDPTTCAMWTALLLSARKNASNVMLYYSGTGSCATLPVYSNSPAPVYVGESN
jgi:hypothetical protein